METASAHVQSGPAVTQPATEPGGLRPARTCADCRHSEIYAEQPRVICTCADSPFAGKAVFSGQPMCARVVPRSGDELTLAWCTPGRKVVHSRFICMPPRL